jgi:hypothetical protein
MKKLVIVLSLVAIVALPSRADANPLKKVGHVAKVAVVKVGEGLGYVVAGLAAIAFCASGGCR